MNLLYRFVRRLSIETLEDRRLLAAGGVTVITHGFQLFSSSAPEWALTMGQAILDRADGALTSRSTGSMLVHDPVSGQWTAAPGSVWNNNYDPADDVVLVYNWADESDEFQTGWLEAAADNLFASLITVNANLPGGLAGTRFIDVALDAGGGGGLLDLHLIGHSRGAVLNSLVAERFDRYFADLVIDHVTTLDGHPASYMDDPGYVSNNPTANSRVFTYDNVVLADNYYQEDNSYEPIFTFDFDGVVANGAYNFRIPSAVLQNGGSSLEHSDVHTWYYGTITEPFAAGYAGFSGAGRNHDGDTSFPDAWWGVSGVPPRGSTGFAYSDIGGASRAGLPVTGSRIDAGPAPTVFNGDFSVATTSGATLHGWERHGGGGSAPKGGATVYLQLSGSNPYRTHNSLYFDRHAVTVQYDYEINAAGAGDVLQVLVGGAVIDAVPLGSTAGAILGRTATLGFAHAGFADTLTFRIVDTGGDGINAGVRIDNIRLAIEPPAPTADFDADGDVDGSDFLAWQRGLGTYLRAVTADGDADGDGNVLGDDLAVWRAGFGASVPTIAAAIDAAMDAITAPLTLAIQQPRRELPETRRRLARQTPIVPAVELRAAGVLPSALERDSEAGLSSEASSDGARRSLLVIEEWSPWDGL